MSAPPHPGKIIREKCIKPLGWTVTEAAKNLGVSRFTLSQLVNGHCGVSPGMAVRLSKTFGGSKKAWLGMTMDYYSWQAEQPADRSNKRQGVAGSKPWRASS